MFKNKHKPIIRNQDEEIEQQDLKNLNQDQRNPKNLKHRLNKKLLISSLITVILSLLVVFGILFLSLRKNAAQSEEINQTLTEIDGTPVYFYDNLTGDIIAHSGTQYDAAGNKIVNEDGKHKTLTIKQAEDLANSINSQPTFCVQIPNGLDGARPQVGLHRASVVFEAIAEAGITRFAAIFKNPIEELAIGPIRSLRLYHLDWDTPFDCTIIHAGGADDALSTMFSSGYKHLSESTTYMWRDSGRWTRSGFSGYFRPNNLFISGPQMANFHEAKENNSPSHPRPFARLTPEESNSQKNLVQTPTKTTGSDQNSEYPTTKSKQPSPLQKISHIQVRFNYQPGFNVNYTYNQDTNTYFRTYASGEAHLSYSCKGTKTSPSPKIDCGEPTQINPDVVIVMTVKERTSPLDNYHEEITTIGSGKVSIFQNGTILEGTWQKADRQSQLIFKFTSGEEIKIKPGRTWISAIPDSYGQLSFQ